VAVWHGKQEMPVARARVYPRPDNSVVLLAPHTHELRDAPMRGALS